MKKILILTTLLLISCYSHAFADSPVIFFSDLIDGPKTGWEGSLTKGAAVTIWGKHFGSIRGSGYVTVGGAKLTNDSDYAEWGVTTNNARGMERITFYLNSSCANEVGTISVTVGSVTSNTVPFYVKQTGYIYFVDIANGSNDFNGYYASYKGKFNGPWKTLPHAGNNVSAGDIVYIRAGTYIETDQYGSLLYLRGSNAGVINNMTAFVGYPTEFPLLDTRTNSSGGAIRNNSQYDGDAKYTTVSKMKIYPYGCAFTIENSVGGNFRLVGLEVDGNNLQLPHASTWSGVIDFHDTHDGWVLGCNIHHWGRDKYDHAIYIGNNIPGTNELNFDIAWNEIGNLGTDVSGIYIHPQDTDSGHSFADNIDIHDNLCHDLEHAGILMYSRTKNIRIYNNIIYNCGQRGGRSAVQLTPDPYYPTYLKFYNNIIYSASNSALLYLGYSGLHADLKNNIFYSKNNTPYVVKDSNPVVTSDYDLYYGNGRPPSWATHSLNSKPLFVDSALQGFRLLNSNPAKDMKEPGSFIDIGKGKLEAFSRSIVRKFQRFYWNTTSPILRYFNNLVEKKDKK